MKRKVLGLVASVSLAAVVTAVWAQSLPKNEGVEVPHQVSPEPLTRTDQPATDPRNKAADYFRSSSKNEAVEAPTPYGPVMTDRPDAPAAYYYRTSPAGGVMFLGINGEPTIDGQLEKWKQASSKAEREKIQQNLRAVLHAEFQARLSAHEKEIDDLEAEVKRLRQQLELRRQKQDDIVRFHMEQLLREAQGLGWGTEPEHGSAAGRLRMMNTPGGFPPAGGISYPKVFRQPTITEATKPRDGTAAYNVNPYEKTGTNDPPAPGATSRPAVEVGPLPKRPPAGASSAERFPPGENPIDIKPDQPGYTTNPLSDKIPAEANPAKK